MELPKDLQKRVQEFAAELDQKFLAAIPRLERNELARAAGKEVTRQLVRPGRPGRPPSDVITRALELYDEAGGKWKPKIFSEAIPGWAAIKPQQQRVARLRLYAAVRRRILERRKAQLRRQTNPTPA